MLPHARDDEDVFPRRLTTGNERHESRTIIPSWRHRRNITRTHLTNDKAAIQIWNSPKT